MGIPASTEAEAREFRFQGQPQRALFFKNRERNKNPKSKQTKAKNKQTNKHPQTVESIFSVYSV